MSGPRGWRQIREEVLRRIHARDWPPGAEIPKEVDLAAELGCARGTVNRALRALAEEGVLERRRRAGTRVARRPAFHARLRIPVIREEIEAAGARYGYRVLSREIGAAEAGEHALGGPYMLCVAALHEAGGAPYALEERRIDLDTVPDAADADFSAASPNEWLLEHVPYTHGALSFDAAAASEPAARALACEPGRPLLRMRRTTWDGMRAVTSVVLTYRPGHAVAFAS